MRATLLKALVQYNFGKDLKAQMLENQARAERMHSIDFGPKGWRELDARPTKVLSWKNSLHSETVLRNSFRLDPAKVVPLEPGKLTQEERARLGVEFNRTFNAFANEYTSSTGQHGPKSRWHYVAAKTSAVTGQQVWVPQVDTRNEDRRQGKAAVDKGRLERDIRTQSSPVVEEIVAKYKESYKDVLAEPTVIQNVTDPDTGDTIRHRVDSMKLAYEDTGFGLPRAELERVGKGGPNDPREPKDVAAAVVITVNKAINDAEAKLRKSRAEMGNQRVPSSAAPGVAQGEIAPSITVDVKKFDDFLDEIWPTAAK
jgi:hypothetical protein